ncbi:MAG: hypothetical protein V7739_20855 [Motiliproteus sp.]
MSKADIRAVKATPAVAMAELITQVRTAVPFDTPMSELCDGPCTGCSKKLLDFLDQELEEWETRLGRGENPTFGDLQRLGKQSQKIYRVLQRNGLIAV